MPAIDTLKDKHALVMGLGRFGGGLGVTRHLLAHGALVTLSDRASADQLAEPLAQLGQHPNLRIIHGLHEPHLLDDADILVVNPAVPTPWDNPFVRAARQRGITVTTEIEIAYRLLNPDRVIAVTGSAGKSTTSAMTHHILTNRDPQGAVLGGNIGGSLLSRLDDITPDTTVVLELSSAMIYWLWGNDQTGQTDQTDQPPPPKVACITSYAPNHLDWHGNETHYRRAKQRLIEILPPTSTAILTHPLADWAPLTRAQTRIITQSDAIKGCTIPGTHNALNAACAIACASVMYPEADYVSLADAARTFPALPHRLNLCHRANAIAFYDDSKCTVPGATLLAVQALQEQLRPGQIHLIVGGHDKGSDLTPVATLAPSLAGLYTIGLTGPTIAKAAPSNAFECQTLERAMHTIIDRALPGDAVLLSPACASWDQFTNYQQRGDRFTALARQLTGQPTC